MHATAAGTVAETALVEALRAGDEDAFEEIFRRHYPVVYGVLLRLTGSPEEAEDLAQEVFLRLYQRPLAGGDGANLGGWLYRVATNLGFNALRARQRRRARLLRWARLEQPLGQSDPGPADDAERRFEAAAVRQALLGLSERDRVALVLRSSGVSYTEIAAAVGVRPGSVGTILARAERALRERYRALNPDSLEE